MPFVSLCSATVGITLLINAPSIVVDLLTKMKILLFSEKVTKFNGSIILGGTNLCTNES